MYVDIHTHHPGDRPRDVVALTDVAGIHPWDATEASRGDVSSVEQLALAPPPSAIGEIGLDYAFATSAEDRELQRTVFEQQLALAARRKLPVVVHCVRAFEPVMDILARYVLPAVIFHGFIGPAEQAARALAKGCYLSFGVRGFASPRTVEAMRRTPLDRLFLETDDDPPPIEEVYARAVEILNIPLETLKAQTYDNYTRIFGAH